MEYEKKYKEALKWVQKLYPSFEGWVKEDAEHYFPELKSDDEKIRKAIHIYLDWLDGRKDYAPKGDYTIRDMIAWLEKQEPNTHKREVDDAYLQGMCDAKHEIEKHGDTNANSSEWSEKDEQMILSIEQVMNCASLLNIVPEKIDNIKSWLKSLRPKKQWKPEVRDWVILNDTVAQILDKQKYGFVGLDTDGKDFFCNYGHTDSMRLWAIADAREGDVLLEEETGEPFIYNGNRAIYFSGYFLGAYCGIYNGKFNPYGNTHHWGENSCPATKEQRDLLFQKMKDAGYEWDAEKKELKKIEPKPLDANRVIEWLECKAFQGWTEEINIKQIVNKFKKDFKL